MKSAFITFYMSRNSASTKYLSHSTMYIVSIIKLKFVRLLLFSTVCIDY